MANISVVGRIVSDDIELKISASSAIAYVKSLNLKNVGHEYIEQACLEELRQYRIMQDMPKYDILSTWISK